MAEHEALEGIKPESMEDILSSIRETVEEEAAAAGKPSPLEDQQDAEEAQMQAVLEEAGEEVPAEAEEAPAPAAEDEALDLSEMLAEDEEAPAAEEPTSADAQPTKNTPDEEVIDIAAFNATGEETLAEEDKVENARELYHGGEAPDPTKAGEGYEADLSEETQAKEEAVFQGEEEQVNLGGTDEEATEETLEKKAEESPSTKEEPAAIPDEQVEQVTEAATAAMAQTVAVSPDAVHLPTTPSADGLQVTFPVEVLATALRPLVKDWVAANLPDVVERLVKEELEKLANQ